VLDLTAINLSLDHTRSSLSLFWDFTRNYCHLDHAAFYISVFATRPQGEELRLLPLIMMVPIDSSRQDLSNGCHIVFLSNFDLLVENPAAASDFATAGDFLDPFLTEFTDKRYSNEAVDTTNR